MAPTHCSKSNVVDIGQPEGVAAEDQMDKRKFGRRLQPNLPEQANAEHRGLLRQVVLDTIHSLQRSRAMNDALLGKIRKVTDAKAMSMIGRKGTWEISFERLKNHKIKTSVRGDALNSTRDKGVVFSIH